MNICARPKNASATREAILQAATARFLQESYDNVGLREVASCAGVDVALVSRYFGGKEGLFRAVLTSLGCDERIQVPAEGLAEALADAMLAKSAGGANLDRLLILLRSASSRGSSDIVREGFQANVLDPLAEALDGPDRDTRAALAMACVLGGAVLSSVFAVTPLAAEDHDRLRARLVTLLSTALAP